MVQLWIVVLAALALLVGPPSARAGDDSGAAIRSAVEQFNARAHFPLPDLSDREVERLLKGKLVRIREVPDDRDQP
ncbi:MAG: hypothetical protein JRI25_26755, partial [Deltaproteobacteria bacterium]|nr:hypothetical protein [Deltaproteobacteria bacterium]